MKQVCRELGNLLNTSKKKSNNSVSRIIIDNKILTNDKDIANALNTHFTQIGKNLASKVVSQEPHSYATYVTDSVDDSLFLRPMNNEELLNEINQLKNKATLDVRVSLIKYIKQEIIDNLVIIFNKSFREGCFPEILKMAKVIPIYKEDDAANPNNYRPISLLSLFNKLLERLMYNRLDSFLHKHKILRQIPVWIQKESCNYKSFDEGNYVFSIYIDLKKAFDTVHKLKIDGFVRKISHRTSLLVDIFTMEQFFNPSWYL